MVNREDMQELTGSMTPESKHVIPLGKVIEAIEMADDLWNQYFDLEKKEVVSVPSDISMNGEVDEDDQEIMEMIEEGWQVRYFGLPSKYDIHEYSIMERFIWELPTDDVQNELERAIRGRGAFRRFKDTLRRFNMEDKWYEYEAQAYRKIAIEWCENNGFEYEE